MNVMDMNYEKVSNNLSQESWERLISKKNILQVGTIERVTEYTYKDDTTGWGISMFLKMYMTKRLKGPVCDKNAI